MLETFHRLKSASDNPYFPSCQQLKQSRTSYQFHHQRYQLSSARISGYSSQNCSPIMSQCRGTTLVLVRVTSTSFSSDSFGSLIFLVITSFTWKYSRHISRHIRLQRGFTNGQRIRAIVKVAIKPIAYYRIWTQKLWVCSVWQLTHE